MTKIDDFILNMVTHGRYIASSGKDHQVRVWEAETRQCVAVCTGPPFSSFVVADVSLYACTAMLPLPFHPSLLFKINEEIPDF